MNENERQAWVDFLDPEVMRPKLISASVYITAFEILKSAIVDRVRGFFGVGFDESGEVIDPRYKSEVLSRNSSTLYACLDWLEEMSAVDSQDLAIFETLKTRRNALAHEMLSTLGPEGLPPDFESLFNQLVVLLHKIEVWWIMNVEIPTNMDLDGREINEDGIIPGRSITVRLLLDIALGNEDQSQYYYEEFLKRTGGK